MARLLLSCAVLLVMFVVAPAAPAMLIDPVANSAQACSITGTRGADRLSGTAVDDRVCGLGGADRMRGQRGHDVLVGGAGGDLLQGKSGRDRLEGGPGNDRVFGGASADDLRGGAGRDALGGGLGPDELSGGAGRDIAYFGQRKLPVRVTIGAGANDGAAGERDDVHADVEGIQAGPGNDVVRGNGGANRLIGAGGNDQLFGGRGNDVLVGGDGDDRLDAREGATATGRAAQAASVDRVVCGGGTDTALVDPVDVVDPGCENVVGGAGTTPRQNPPAQNPPAQNPPAPQNNAPTAVDDSTTVGEDATADAIDVLANDTDSDGGAMTIVSASDPANGAVVLTGGSAGAQTGLTYQPDANYCGPDTFTYTLNGGSTATVSVTVTCADDLPTAVDDAAAVPEDSAATPLAVLANDSDPDGDAMTIASASDPANGTVVLTGGLPGAHTGLTYQPDPNYCSATPDTFTYTLNGGSTATVSVTVTCGDDAPTAVDDTATVGEDSAAGAINVLANDTDSDGGAMTIASASDPANGTVVLTGGSAGAHTGLTYQPDANYCGPDTFTYTLNGGSTATVSVTVTCVDDAPTAIDDSATVAEDSGATGVDVLANDTDTDGGPKSVASVTQPANGTVVITGAGSGLTYQPNANFCSATPDSFTYTLNGGDSATVSVTVTCADDPPTAVNDTATVAEDAAATGVDVLANDTDVDGGPRSVSAVTQPTNGTVVITGGGTGLTYRPNLGYCNDPPGTMPDVFTYTLNGGSTATVSVTVTCNDDAPTAVDDSATVAEDSPASAIGVLANDTDTDGGPRSVASVTQPANGAVVITGGGSGLTYQPNANYCNSQAGGAPDTFTYTLNGGDSATVSVTVTCVDDPPTAVDDAATVVEDSAAGAVVVLANDLNADGGPITVASASDPANGTVVVTGGGTGLTYQPDANYCNSQAGGAPDTFTYTLTGGSTATVAMTVTCAPDNPVVDTSAGSTSYTENAAAIVIDAAVTVSDPDAATTITGATIRITGNYAGSEDVLTLGGTHPGITPVVSGDTLTLTGNASVAAYQAALRAVTYRNGSDAPSTAPRTVTFTVTDDTSRTSSDTKGLTVTAVDDPPVAVADSATVLEDAAATAIAVLTNDTDVDAGPRSIASVTQPANGTVAITGGGTGLTYQPNANYCNSPPGTTPSTFTYTLNGGSTATVSVTVTCVNDAPVADDETFDGANGAIGNTSLVVNDPDDGAPALGSPKKSISGDILAGDSDIDGPGPLTVTAGTFATNDGGSVTIEADGDFIYINDPADNCADTSDFFDYTLEDSGTPELTDTGRVTIAVAGCVWYVSNNAAGNSGSSRAPFDTLTQAETASLANHTVFVFDGDNTSTGYGGNGYTMNAGERLIGEHEGLTVDPDQGGPLASQTLHPANPGAHPTLTATGADVIDLDDANEVRGLTIDPQGTGGGIAGSTGDVSGTIDDVNITDTGTAGTQPGLELDATTGSFAVSNLAVSTNGATGARLNNAGTVTFAPTGNISITTTGAAGLLATGGASGTNMGTSVFDAITVTGSGAGGVSLTNTTGTTTFGELALTTTSGATAAFALSNAGTVSVPTAGTANLSATGGPAVDVTGTAGANLAFDAVSSTNSTTDGINLAGLGTGTFSAASGTLSGATGIAFDVDGGSGAVSYAGTIANSATGRAADITSRTGNTTLSGNITGTGGTGINVSGNTAGTTTFSGTTKTLNTGANAAVTLSSNTGHTIAFSGGGLAITTTSGAGFTATGGGTVTVAGAANTIASTTGTALNVANTTIGSSGLTFQSVSANGAANGIVLTNTGSSGGLTVTGSSSGLCGGQVTVNAVGTPATVTAPNTADCTGGTIQSTTGHGIVINNASQVSLARMRIMNSGLDGINVLNINGFALNNSYISDSSGVAQDRGIEMGDFSTGTPVNGAITIANSTIGPTPHDNFSVGISSGTSTWSITGSVLTDSQLNSGFNFEIRNATVSSFTIDGSVFSSQFADGMQMQPASNVSATVSSATIQNSTFIDNNLHMDLNHDGTGTTTYKVLNNTFRTSAAQAINLFSSAVQAPATGGTLNARFVNNRIGVASVPGSGGGGGLRVNINGGVDATVLIDSNVVRQTPNGRGFDIISRNGTAGLDVTITNNEVNNDFVTTPQNQGFALASIFVQSNCVTVCNTLRADIRGNTVPATPPNGELLAAQLALIESQTSTLQLVDNAPTNANCTDQLTSQNTGNASANAGCSLITGPISIPPA